MAVVMDRTREFPHELAERLAGDIIEKTEAHTVMQMLELERLDLVAEGIARAVKDWPKFDPDKAQQQTFLYMSIRAGIFDYLRREGSQNRRVQKLGGLLPAADKDQELAEWLTDVYESSKRIYTAKRFRQGRRFYNIAQLVALAALLKHKSLSIRGLILFLNGRDDLLAVLHLRRVPGKSHMGQALQFLANHVRTEKAENGPEVRTANGGFGVEVRTENKPSRLAHSAA